MLTKQQKVQIVGEIAETLKNSSIVLLVDYKGLSVEKISNLRGALRENGGTLRVAKNTLIKIALKQAGYEDEKLHDAVDETNALLTVSQEGDPMAVLKALVQFQKENKMPSIRLGAFEGKLYDEAGVVELSKLPSRDELLGMLLNRMQGPISKMVFGLNAIILKLVYAVNAVREKKESE